MIIFGAAETCEILAKNKTADECYTSQPISDDEIILRVAYRSDEQRREQVVFISEK